MFKTSLYNYFLNEDSHFIYFNGVSSCVFSVTLKEHEQLQLLFLDLISFEINYNSVFNNFVKWGFIVEEDVNEIDIIRYKNKQDVYGNGFYNLVINPTLECNFNCWYCYEEHSSGRMTLQCMDRIIKYIDQCLLVNRISSFQLDWFGGEPLLCFDEVIYPISKIIKEKMNNNAITFSNVITTNGALINEEMVSKFKEINLNNFQITFDGCEEYHNKVKKSKTERNEYTILWNNIFLLCDILDSPSILVRINYTEETLKNIINIIDDIPKKYLQKLEFTFQQVWQTQENFGHIDIDNIRQEMISAGLKVLSNNLELHSYKCYADVLSQAVITNEGKVFKCTARDFANEEADGYLLENGTIEWGRVFYDRMSKTTIENEKCLNCKFLPACWGPCSQKILGYKNDEFDKICNVVGLEKTIKDLLSEFYKKEIKNSIS